MPWAEIIMKLGTQALSTLLGVSGLLCFYTSFDDATSLSAETCILLLCSAVGLVWAMDDKASDNRR